MILASIGRGFRLDQPAAESFKRTLAIRPGMLRLINSAYRSHAHQLRLYTAWVVYRRVLAAKPGTSLHNKGLALDIDSNPSTADHRWMVAHGRAYGWIRTIPHIEAWHFEYFASLDQHRGDRIAAPAPITTQEDDDMRYFTTGGKGSPIYELGPSGSWLHLTGAQWSAIGKPEATTVTPDELVAIASLAAQRRKSLA